MVSTANNKVVLLTGGSGGLGRTAAKRFLDEGYTVVITGRTIGRLEEAVEWIDPGKQARTRLHTIVLDLESLESIRNAIDSFKALGLPLDILLNNAGRTTNEREYAKDTKRVEKTIFANAIGPWYLSMQLAPFMKPRSRILFVTSRMHNTDGDFKFFGMVEKEIVEREDLFDALDGTPNYGGIPYYRISKLAMVWLTYVMARQFPSLDINTFCPGFVPITDLNRESTRIARWSLRYVMPWFVVTTSEEKSISEYFHYAASEELAGATGRYFEFGQVSKSSQRSYSMVEANKFWNLSCEICNTPEYQLK
ncbi:hypothetical protein BJV82DRAFT_662106 [Fennellomyces sp. T-0311]|nr:hypothetical protein BJV82DRAFT_662106 [Fennellomyces sp. T-0311]